jgi:NAD(P)-dependent dehydrogenase (short-subunit alcohol dehydrogenase family)
MEFMEEVIKTVYEVAYNLWCFICLYSLGLLYMPIEVNRKLDWFSMVRKLDPIKDLPSDLSHLSVIMTGGSRGIGWEAAKMLLERGARVIIASSVPDGKEIQDLKDKLVSRLKQESSSKGELSDGDEDKQLLEDEKNDKITDSSQRLECWHLDLSSFSSVISFVHRFSSSGRHLNLLINNAGQMYSPFRVTKDGYESHWEINYLSHCLLVALLLPILEETAKTHLIKSRIINVASSTHFARNLSLSDVNGFQVYSPYHAYAQSKLAQIMFTYKLNDLLSHKSDNLNDQEVLVNCVHPGVAKTELYENVWWVKTFPALADILFRVSTKHQEEDSSPFYSCGLSLW